MQKQNDLAKNLKNLFNPSSYKEFQEGELVNQPRMTGYYYIFKNLTKPRFSLILNTAKDFTYPNNTVKISDYFFIVFNVPSLEEYLQNFTNKYFPVILEKLDENMLKKNPRGLPYGYYADEDGTIRVDLKKATEVKKIYDMYLDVGSVRDIVDALHSNFSHVRNVLSLSGEYMQMKEKIVPPSKLKEVEALLAQNVKGAFKKRTTEDEIREVRQKRKQQQKMLGIS